VGLLGGHPLALVPNPRDLDDVVASIQRLRPGLFAGVPTLFLGLLNHPDVKAHKVDFRCMQLCLSGAAPLLAETKRRFEPLIGGTLAEVYSLSEALLAAVAQPLEQATPAGSVGLPLPDVEVRIADADGGGVELAAGEVGEILLRAPQVMPGYWQAPAETAETLREHGEGPRWLHTGDLGWLDERGFLYVVDRKKDLIKPGGLQVWPREVEEVIAQHLAVAEVGVAGVPDPVQGEAVKAWVVLREGTHATENELRAYCKERLAPHKVPARVEFRDALPKTMVGEVLRRALREQTPALS
jgi:long-chain acyl-CoA synthetase